MRLMVVCSYCKRFIRFKDAETNVIPKIPISHGICTDCLKLAEEEINNIKGGNNESERQACFG